MISIVFGAIKGCAGFDSARQGVPIVGPATLKPREPKQVRANGVISL